jgi:hypothetical protein
MKTLSMQNEKTYNVNYLHYINSEAEKENEQFEIKILSEVKTQAKRDAEDGLPRLIGDHIEPYIGEHFQQIQKQNDRNREHFGGDETTDLTVTKFNHQLNDERNNRDEIESTLNEARKNYTLFKDGYPGLLAGIVAFFVFGLCVADGLLLKEGLRVVIPNNVSALFASITIGLGLGLLAHKIPLWWNLGRNTMIKWLMRLTIIGGFSLLFFFFGLLRSFQGQLNHVALDSAVSIDLFSLADPKEAGLFMLLSWLIFGIAIVLTPYSPKFNEWKNLFQLRSQKKKVKKLEEQFTASQSRIAKILEELDDIAQWDYSRKKKAHRQEQRLIKLLSLVKAAYINSNLRFRRGTDRPDCFDDKSYKFYLTTYFQEAQKEADTH